MKNHGRLFMGVVQLLFLLVFLSPAMASDIEVSDIEMQKLNLEGEGYGWYLLKCKVKNNTDEAGTVSIQLRSVDKYAYYRKDVELWGHVQAGAVSTLSVKGYMDAKTLDDITKWEVIGAHLKGH